MDVAEISVLLLVLFALCKNLTMSSNNVVRSVSVNIEWAPIYSLNSLLVP